MANLVQSRRNRQTSTVIDVIDLEPGADQRWETICVDHGTVCSHDTRELAMSFAAAPLEWCEECMEAREAP